MQTGATKQYSIIHPLCMSFFSRSLYRDVARNWKGLCLTYFIMLLTLNLIPDLFRLQNHIADLLTEEAPKVVRQVPTITISKGVVSIDKPVPYTINAPWSTAPFMVIDTSAKNVSPADYKATVILTRTKLMVKSDDSEMRSIDLSRIDSLAIDQNRIYQWISSFKTHFIFLVYPFALFFASVYYGMQVVLCSAAGMLFAKLFNLELTIPALIRLSVIAFTPPLLLQIAHSLLDIEFPYSAAISLSLALGYLYFAIGSCSEKTVSTIT